jgi:hypothetical protein
MPFTNIAAVAGMYPAFQRNAQSATKPVQKPADGLIQQFIDDIASVIQGVLERRFQESIHELASDDVSAWLYGLGLPNRSWYQSTAYAIGDSILDENSPMGIWIVKTAGTSGDSAPRFPSSGGADTSDGSAAWKSASQTAQFRVLERGNRYGAAAQLGRVLATLNMGGADRLATEYKDADWQPFIDELNAKPVGGGGSRSLSRAMMMESLQGGGAFDYLFDPHSKVATPRPLMMSVPGGDQDISSAPADSGASSFFGKFGIDFGRSSWPFGQNQGGIW